MKFNKSIVVIYGNNTKGKSTILESIFLALNGYSPWDNTFENIVQKNKDFFSITIELDEEISLTIYQNQNSKNYLLDKKKVSRKKFFSFYKATLFSPEQIELLMYLSQKRREFLDNLISEIDIEYKEDLSSYKKVLRQRNSYLKKLAKNFFEKNILDENDIQIKYWDEILVKLASKIMVRRATIIEKLKNDNFSIKYKPSLVLNLFEDMLDIKEIEKIYHKQIKENFKKDVVTGHSNIGIHRDDWSIFSTDEDLKKFGSRGEKRLGIANLILQTQEIYKEFLGYYPILLLDDISAELDDENSKKIFSNKIIEKQQVFITTTKKDNIPKNLLNKSQAIKLN